MVGNYNDCQMEPTGGSHECMQVALKALPITLSHYTTCKEGKSCGDTYKKLWINMSNSLRSESTLITHISGGFMSEEHAHFAELLAENKGHRKTWIDCNIVCQLLLMNKVFSYLFCRWPILGAGQASWRMNDIQNNQTPTIMVVEWKLPYFFIERMVKKKWSWFGEAI